MNNKEIDYAAKWSLEDAVEVTLEEKEDFHKVCETLTRIGHREGRNELTQLCYLFHKQGRYWIIHYKGMFAIDGDTSYIYDVEDVEKQNKVASLIHKYGLAKVVNENLLKDLDQVYVKVVRYPEKNNWTFNSPYTFGRKVEY